MFLLTYLIIFFLKLNGEKTMKRQSKSASKINIRKDTKISKHGRNSENYKEECIIDGNNTSKTKKYYHSIVASKESFNTLTPKGYYENIAKDTGCPETATGVFESEPDEPPEFIESDIPEISFSKSLEGAILGGLKTQFDLRWAKINDKHWLDIYMTDEEPDIDISKCEELDFDLLEEVRYRRTILVKKIATIEIDPYLELKVLMAYDKMDFKKLEKIKKIVKKEYEERISGRNGEI